MNNWKKGVVLTTDRRGLPGQIQCAECCGIISPGTKFYIEDYVEDKFCLTTRFFHFNCVQTAENKVITELGIAKIKYREILADMVREREQAKEEVELAQDEQARVEREESCLRETIGKLAEGRS